MRNKFIGFDTSNYTTSVGMLTGAMSYINQKKLLPVVNGDKGLRQSDAVFLHVKALPDLMQGLDISSPTAIGVSTRPRSIDGSYMPCFLPGILAAKTMASASGAVSYTHLDVYKRQCLCNRRACRDLCNE